MQQLLSIAHLIDHTNRHLSKIASWLVLLCCVVSAGNALSRYGLNLSSNAWLEIQWYMFAAMFMLGAAYTLCRNEHVRVDVIYSHLSTRAQIWIDLIGGLLFLLPAAVILAWLSWPVFYNAWLQNEMSSNAGGLIRWPVKIFLPLGFGLLVLQGVSEVIKRIAMLTGHLEAKLHYEKTAAMIPLDLMAPLMFGALVLFMLVGYPVAFSLAAVGLSFAFVAVQSGYFEATLLQALPERVFGIMANDLLLAIPFFTFMGAILERCGLAEDLLEGMGQLFGPVRGGLAYAVILVGAILGAITGTVAASVIAMGLISLPIMMRYKYNIRLATGVIAASGTITQLIPPSLVLVVLADQLGKSVGDMYAGAIGASIVQVLLFCAYIAILSIVKPTAMPALPRDELTLRGWPLYRRILWGMVPCLVLIFLVLGTILMGLATPTEAGAMGAIGAIVLAVLHHPKCSRRAKAAAIVGAIVVVMLAIPGIVLRFDATMPAVVVAAAHTILDVVKTPLFFVFYGALTVVLLESAIIVETRGLIRQGMDSTLRITAMVIFILIGSSVFTLVFRGLDGDRWIEGLLTSLPGGATGFLIFVNIFVFVLAFFLDFFEIAFIIIPLLAPVAAKLGIDLIWFGILLGANMQTSFMHPPFGFALFYLRGIAPKEVKSSDIYWGAIPWVVLQVMLVAILVFWPGLVTSFLDKERVYDINKIHIEVPADAPRRREGAPGSREQGQSADDDDPTKAIERAMRGDTK